MKNSRIFVTVTYSNRYSIMKNAAQDIMVVIAEANALQVRIDEIRSMDHMNEPEIEALETELIAACKRMERLTNIIEKS